MSYDQFTSLNIEVRDRVAWMSINNPPINLFDLTLIGEVLAAGGQLAEDDNVSVVVMQSADPEIFIAHADVNLLLEINESEPSPGDVNSLFHAMTELYRLMPKLTIGKLDGIARGGGLEILAALDMRFCSIENTVIGQPEILAGLVPGGGGSSRWPRIIGTARALEINMSGVDIDGPMAERYGMFNRAIPAAELSDYVDRLALHIASHSPTSIRLLKEIAYDQRPIEDVLQGESIALSTVARLDSTKATLTYFLANNGQSRENVLSPIELK